MKTIIWQNKDGSDYSIEYFNLTSELDVHILRGTVILLLEQTPTLAIYEIKCDKYWKTRSVKISQQTPHGKDMNIDVTVDRDQIWRKHRRETSYSSIIDFASGLYDVDLQIIPVTNTLPIKRIDLKDGWSQETCVLWIGFPSLALERQVQKYSRINDKLYIFEIPSTGFKAHLEVDELGLVVNYDTLWHRLY